MVNTEIQWAMLSVIKILFYLLSLHLKYNEFLPHSTGQSLPYFITEIKYKGHHDLQEISFKHK